MSRPKAFLKQGRSKKAKEQALETVDDFQSAGVEFEDAAGKWRAGDAAKSLRMFGRAVEVYDQGLRRFPQSLDLAYNKARVQLEIATHPILVKALQVPVLAVLEEALASHRYALNVDQDNADTLFNASQVLTAIAEEYAKDPNRADQDALQPLEEALALQDRCLSLQELKFEESREEAAAMVQQTTSENERDITAAADIQGDDSEQISSAAEDQWFSVVEPITKDTLIDTALAQLATLTTLCSILSSSVDSAPSSSLAWVEEYSSKLLSVKLPAYADDAGSERLQEIALAKAIFISALLEAGYRMGKVNAETYKRERDAVFSIPELLLDSSADALLANAQSLVSYNSALADSPTSNPADASTRWNALSAATANLARAANAQSILPTDIPQTHLLRGDVSLLQTQLSHPPTSFPAATANRTQLLKNAEVFYRNAAKLSQDEEQKAVGRLREIVARVLQEGSGPTAAQQALLDLGRERGQEWMQTQLAEIVDEGLVSSDVGLLYAQS